MSLIDPTVRGPAKAAKGEWGLCPRCESGGRERPCWQCQYDGGDFTMGVLHLVQVPR